MDAQFEALAAWVDGEPVARTEVALALDTREGREYVMDLMALRHMVNVSTPSLPEARPQRPVTRRWPAIVAAAAAVVLSLSGGFLAGRMVSRPALVAGTDAAVTPITTPASISAPAPTRVIQLEENTSWRESGGS